MRLVYGSCVSALLVVVSAAPARATQAAKPSPLARWVHHELRRLEVTKLKVRSGVADLAAKALGYLELAHVKTPFGELRLRYPVKQYREEVSPS